VGSSSIGRARVERVWSVPAHLGNMEPGHTQSVLLLLLNTTRTRSGPPSTRASIAKCGVYRTGNYESLQRLRLPPVSFPGNF